MINDGVLALSCKDDDDDDDKLNEQILLLFSLGDVKSLSVMTKWNNFYVIPNLNIDTKWTHPLCHEIWG